MHHQRDFNLPAAQRDDLWFIHRLAFYTGPFVIDSQHYEWIDGFNFAYEKGTVKDPMGIFFIGRIIVFIEVPLAWYVPGWIYGFPFLAIPPVYIPMNVSEGEQFQVEYLQYYDYYFFFFLVIWVPVFFTSITIWFAGYDTVFHLAVDRFNFGTKQIPEQSAPATEEFVLNEAAPAAGLEASLEKKYDLRVERDESGEVRQVEISFKPGSSPSSDGSMWDDFWNELKEAVGFQGSPTEEELAGYLGDLGLLFSLNRAAFGRSYEVGLKTE